MKRMNGVVLSNFGKFAVSRKNGHSSPFRRHYNVPVDLEPAPANCWGAFADAGETRNLKMKKREERERELKELLATEAGKQRLIEICKKALKLNSNQTLPPGTSLVQEILRAEYPEQ